MVDSWMQCHLLQLELQDVVGPGTTAPGPVVKADMLGAAGGRHSVVFAQSLSTE